MDTPMDVAVYAGRISIERRRKIVDGLRKILVLETRKALCIHQVCCFTTHCAGVNHARVRLGAVRALRGWGCRWLEP